MDFAKFTAYETGKPLWIRKDQVACWFSDRGHYHIVPLFDEIDMAVKETGEEILAKMKGDEVNGIQGTKDQPVVAGGHGTLPEIPPGRKGQRRGGGRHDASRLP